MIDRMLFCARAENPETQINKEWCDVGLELATVCDFYELSAAEAGVRLAVAVAKSRSSRSGPFLFQRAVGNLVANALAHTPAGGTVTLTASGER